MRDQRDKSSLWREGWRVGAVRRRRKRDGWRSAHQAVSRLLDSQSKLRTSVIDSATEVYGASRSGRICRICSISRGRRWEGEDEEVVEKRKYSVTEYSGGGVGVRRIT